jgi:hypothetical protein
MFNPDFDPKWGFIARYNEKDNGLRILSGKFFG